MAIYHTPIMGGIIIDFLNLKKNSIIADLTTGEGGHSSIIAPLIPDGKLICLDRDNDILSIAKERLNQFTNIQYFCDTYDNITEIRKNHNIPLFDGVLVDMGISMFHFKGADRGFSFEDNCLDMRLGNGRNISAEQIINTFSEKDLADIFYYYGEERYSRRFAREIVKRRPFFSAKDLANYILKTIGRHGRIHPATKIFQALRIFVNEELEIAEDFFNKITQNLVSNGILCVLTFHSLEDRLVKNSFKSFIKRDIGTIPFTKPLIPSLEECKNNPAARSAKLRVFQRN